MPWPEDPCAWCPRVSRGLSVPCLAQVTRYRAYCTMSARGDPLAIACVIGGLAPSVATVTADVMPSRPVTRTAVPAPDFGDRRHMVVFRAAERCPHRLEVLEGCCAKTRCASAGRRPGQVVGIMDCMSCVRDNLDEALRLAGMTGEAATMYDHFDPMTDNMPMPIPVISPTGHPVSGLAPSRPSRPPPAVAVVIPSHDYGCYLPEAIASALDQDPRPAEILVVDDASSDDTPAVVARYADQGVRYLRVEYRDVYRTRKAGLDATVSPLVCFLDADDQLMPGYLTNAAVGMALNRNLGIVYSDTENFGDSTGRSDYPTSVRRGRLDVDNFIHAGSVVRRQALEDSGAFDGLSPPLDSHADWYVWRRVVAAGWDAVKQPVPYRYRRHGATMLHRALSRPYYDQASLNLTDVTIFTPLSGRVWAWPRYFDWIRDQDRDRNRTRLVLLDTSGDPEFGPDFDVMRLGYADVRYRRLSVGPVGLADQPRHETVEEVRAAVRRVYAAMVQMVETPYVLVVEDDVIPPPGVIDGLLRSMDRDVAMVAAPYPARNDTTSYVCWTLDGYRSIADLKGRGVFEAKVTGFGCSLIRRCVLQGETFASDPGDPPEYDIAFCLRLRRAGWRILVDSAFECEHRSPPG
jgi:glycosyltransferase involved in cell wall biosynthesis